MTVKIGGYRAPQYVQQQPQIQQQQPAQYIQGSYYQPPQANPVAGVTGVSGAPARPLKDTILDAYNAKKDQIPGSLARA